MGVPPRNAEGDRVMITSGDTMEQRGATNTLRMLQVGADGVAEGMGSL
jgi:pyruvate kinase